MFSPCPNCGNMLYRDYDGFETFFTCMICARNFTLEGKPIAMTPKKYHDKHGIVLTTRKYERRKR